MKEIKNKTNNNIKKKLEDFWDLIKLPKGKRPKLIINIGDNIQWDSPYLSPLLTKDNIQYILEYLQDNDALEYYIQTNYNDKFYTADGSIYYKKYTSDVYIGSIRDFIIKHIIWGIDEFYSYFDFDKSKSDIACVGYISKTSEAIGFIDRVIFKYRMNEEFDINKGHYIFMKNRIIPEDEEEYEKENERIKKIIDWSKNGKLVLDTKEKLLYVAFRSAEAIA